MTNIDKRRKRTSIVWKLSDESFIELVENSKSIKDVLCFFNMQNKGNNFLTVKTRIQEMNLTTDHFLSRIEASNLTRTLSLERFKNEWLLENSDKSRFNLKKYLLKFKLLDYVCDKCGNIGEWMGDRIILQLEHINGVSNDNRIENLCFLCPNCHSQTPTYAGKKNKKTNVDKKYYSCDCGGDKKCKNSKRCVKCNGGNQSTKITWPNIEYFEKNLWKKPTTIIAQELGVSDKAVEKYIKKLGLTKPPRGYWSKFSH